MATLYAWAVPAFIQGTPMDHTWVTTYDNRTSVYPDERAVGKAGEEYWFCWGSFHAKGGTPADPTGFLGAAAGNRRFAKCLVTANADSRSARGARGTIFNYGVDGVCHQLANQVLFATGRSGSPPLLVRHARWYAVSSLIYGDYGLQAAAWKRKISLCSTKRKGSVAIGGSASVKTMDDFQQRARAVLRAPEDQALLIELLALRELYQRELRTAVERPNTSAEELNARNQAFLDQVANLLGAARFEAILGISPGTQVNLVDPDIRSTTHNQEPQ